jgi:hypothetical protein
MKAVSLLVLFCIVASSCSQDESKVVRTGSISFSPVPKVKAGANSRIADTAPPAAVLLTIKDSNGNAVHESKKLSLFTFGQSYTSESLKLNIGNYTLTQFIVLDAADNAIYATPLQNSDMAKYVSAPLPISFAVSDGGTTSIVPEVLAQSDVTKRLKSISARNIFANYETVKDSIVFVYDNDLKITDADWYYFDWDAQKNNYKLETTYHESRKYGSQNELLSVSYPTKSGSKEFIYDQTYYPIPIPLIITEPDPYNLAKNMEFHTLEITNKNITKRRQIFLAGNTSWLLEYKFDANDDLVEFSRYNENDPTMYEKYTIQYDAHSNPLNHVIEANEIEAFDGIVDEAFYYSAHNPTKVIWSTSLCTPCTNISSEYSYEYDSYGHPTKAIYTRNGRVEEIMTYSY